MTASRGTVPAANPAAAVSSPGSPQYARLFVGDVHYEAIEFSAAGVSLARWAVRSGKLSALSRGDECEATLCLGGLGWEESYAVVLRFAVRGPKHLGLAFASLPPTARQRLMQTPPDEIDPNEASPPGEPGPPRHVPFSFARLMEDREPVRRLVLPTSASVLSHTLARSRDNGSSACASVGPPPLDVLRRAPARSYASHGRPAGTLFVYGVALFAVVTLLLGVLFG
jgi:hypothetical protein